MIQKLSYPELQSAVLRRVFRRPSGYAELCEKSWTIAPVEHRMEREAIYLEGELEKVRDVQEDTTREAEMKRLARGVREHAPTVAYRFSDVCLVHGRLIKGAMSVRLSELADPAGDACTELRSVAVASTYMGSIYFGHWLRDDATQNLTAEALGPTISVARKDYTHEDGYRELLTLRENRVTHGHFDELVLLDDWGQNADKRRRYQVLRERFRQAVPASGNQRIYIRRGRTAHARGRDLVNTEEIEALLSAQGFVAVDPDVMSAREIARISSGAQLILSLEGSHLAHSIYSIAEGGTLVVLQPPFRFNNVYKDLADAMGLRYAFVVGDPAENGFTIDPDRLRRLLDLASAP